MNELNFDDISVIKLALKNLLRNEEYSFLWTHSESILRKLFYLEKR